VSCECCKWCDRDHDDDDDDDDQCEQHCQQRQVSCYYYAICYRGLLTRIFQIELR